METWHMMNIYDYEEYGMKVMAHRTTVESMQLVKYETVTQYVMFILYMCVCKLTPVARTGEAEPAGTGDAWR